MGPGSISLKIGALETPEVKALREEYSKLCSFFHSRHLQEQIEQWKKQMEKPLQDLAQTQKDIDAITPLASKCPPDYYRKPDMIQFLKDNGITAEMVTARMKLTSYETRYATITQILNLPKGEIEKLEKNKARAEKIETQLKPVNAERDRLGKIRRVLMKIDKEKREQEQKAKAKV